MLEIVPVVMAAAVVGIVMVVVVVVDGAVYATWCGSPRCGACSRIEERNGAPPTPSSIRVKHSL